MGGYCAACLEADKLGMGEWRGEAGIKDREYIACTSIDWTWSRRCSPHLAKTPMGDAEREKRKNVTAKRNKVEKQQKAAAKKLRLTQAQWIADFSDIDENDESEDEDEDEDEDDIIDDDEEMAKATLRILCVHIYAYLYDDSCFFICFCDGNMVRDGMINMKRKL